MDSWTSGGEFGLASAASRQEGHSCPVFNGEKPQWHAGRLFNFACGRPRMGNRDNVWRYLMLIRPRDLADQISGMPPAETHTLSVDAARSKAREILGQFPKGGYLPIVENWRQLADGQVELTVRHLPTAD